MESSPRTNVQLTENSHCFILEKKHIEKFTGKNLRLMKEIYERCKVKVCLYPLPNVDYQVCKLTGHNIHIQVALGTIANKIPDANLTSIAFTLSPVSGLQVNQELSIKIVSFLTPGHFYVQVESYKNYTDQNRMNRDLNEAYIDQTHLLSKAELRVQNLCAVLHEGNCYRATIVAIETDDIVVRLLDYGRTVTVAMSNLRKLLDVFQQTSFQAVECKLNNLQSIQGEWSPEAWNFMQWISEKPSRIKLKSFDTDGSILVELLAIITRSNNWTSINSVLVNKSYATFITHPLESTGDYECQHRKEDKATSASGEIEVSIGSELLCDVYKRINTINPGN